MGFLSRFIGNAGLWEKEKLQKEFGYLLIEGEQFEIGFKLIRDVFSFTNKRLILIDKQGITGKKIEYMTIPYQHISRFSVETAGVFDLDAELRIWVDGEPRPSVKKRFNKKVNIYEVERVLSRHILN